MQGPTTPAFGIGHVPGLLICAGLVHCRGQPPQHLRSPGQSPSIEHFASHIPIDGEGLGQDPGFLITFFSEKKRHHLN